MKTSWNGRILPKTMTDWLGRPVWLAGMMRSGTTLLLSLLDGDPALAVYPDEPSFQRLFDRTYRDAAHLRRDLLLGTPAPMHLGPAAAAAGLYPPGFRNKGQTALPADFSIPDETLAALKAGHTLRGVPERALADVFDFSRYFSELDRHFAGMEGPSPREAVLACIRAFREACRTGKGTEPQRWLFKQPMANFRRDRMDWFREAFPEGRIVLIVRDPRGQYASSLKYAEKQGRTYGARRSKFYFLQILRKMRRSYLDVLRAIDEIPADSLLPVFYEDLTQEPEKVLRDIAAFLGIPAPDRSPAPTRLGIGSAVVTGSGDFGARVNAEAAQAWRTELYPFEIAALETWLRPFFRRFPGRYEPSAPSGILTAHGRLFLPLYLPALAERAGLAGEG